MASTTPTLNGTAFTPSSIRRQRRKYGTVTKSANGTRVWTQRGEKSEWDLQFEDVPLSVVTALTTVYNLTSTFTFVDEDGSSFTVQCEEDALQFDVSQFGPTRLYTASLKIYQA